MTFRRLTTPRPSFTFITWLILSAAVSHKFLVGRAEGILYRTSFVNVVSERGVGRTIPPLQNQKFNQLQSCSLCRRSKFVRPKSTDLAATKAPYSNKTEDAASVDDDSKEGDKLLIVVKDHGNENTTDSSKRDSDWTTASSIGSYLLQRKEEEEAQLRLKENSSSTSSSTSAPPEVKYRTPGSRRKRLRELLRKKKNTVEIIDMTTDRGVIKGEERNKDETAGSDVGTRETNVKIGKNLTKIDKEVVRELDEGITKLTGSSSDWMKDIKILPITGIPSRARSASRKYIAEDAIDKTQREREGLGRFRVGWKSESKKDLLPWSDPEHYMDRIGRDMRHLAVAIASNINSVDQWRLFCQEGGGLSQLLQCVRDGARSVEEGGAVIYEDEAGEFSGFTEKHEESLMAACAACRALRDVCAISPELSAVITEGILRADAAWSVPVPSTGKNDVDECFEGGLFSDLTTLLRHASEAEKLYRMRRKNTKMTEKVAFRRTTRRSRREARRRCNLYVVQLLLAMAFSSDAAINTMRRTSGLTEAVLACSSYARKERTRRWLRYPVEVIKWLFRSKSEDEFAAENEDEVRSRPFIAAASVRHDLEGQVQGTANQVLATIGYNQWVPKIPGQKGLRILCLDGGGTRGIAAITTLRSIVQAMGGVEVCDTFDIIAGTSTGAIIAFLVGLRRETSREARKRYNALIKRIFVKSPLSTPMLIFTTASYDEGGFMQVLKEILGDTTMLDTRADPSVPLVFAVSSKMSSTPTQVCLFRNYNYSGGELPDNFVIDPEQARLDLGLKPDKFDIPRTPIMDKKRKMGRCVRRTGEGSRHPGSFRVLQRFALRASTAAPTVFKPLLMGGELYCDGGMVASNPTAIAIHEARILFPNVPIEMVVSCGTGGFVEEKTVPRIGWDGIIGQIVQSATDGEQTHHILEDILGQGGTAQLGRSSVSKTKYYRLNPLIGMPNDFPLDGTDPEKLEELSRITDQYLQEEEQQRKLKEIGDTLLGKRGLMRFL